MGAAVDMDYIASDELGNFVRLRFFLDVQYTYVVRSVQYTSKHVQRTLDYVQDRWAMVVYGDGLADGKLSDSCH